jgi:hypothetical protein
MPPHLSGEDDGLRHDRDALYLSAGAKSAAGGCAPLVVPQPVPRFARTAAMPGKHKFVSREVWQAAEPESRS